MKMKVFLISLLCISLFSGCTKDTKPTVAVTVYPVLYLVERIAQEYVNVEMISEDDTLIQRAQLKDDYEEILDASKVLFYIGGLEPYMSLYIEDIRNTGVDTLDLATKSAIYTFERYTTTIVDGKMTGVGSDYYDGDVFSTIDTYDNDPNLWMDPVAMTSMASDIRDYLSNAYPEYKDIFEENYDQLELDLARLDASFQSIPNNEKTVSFVSMTPSFGVWQKSYGLKVYPVCLSKYGVLPSSEQLEIIKKKISSDHVRYIAIEDNLPDDMIELRTTLIDELGLIPVKLTNLSTLSEENTDAGRDYLSLMYDNLEVLEDIAY